MSNLTGLFQDVDNGGEELAKEELSNSTGGSSYVTDSGVYKGTIARCFAYPTKVGGVCVEVHFEGDTSHNVKLYPVTVKKKNGKPIKENGNVVKTSTYTVKGKTQSLADYKMLKQLVFVAIGKGQELKDIVMEEKDISYKEYGKDKTVKAGELTELIGKTIHFGIRLEEEYNYEDGEVDKTAIKTNNNGDVVYKKPLFSVYDSEGKTALEIVKQAEPTQIEKDKEFLASDKGIKKVKLEAPEIEEVEDVVDDIDEDDIDF